MLSSSLSLILSFEKLGISTSTTRLSPSSMMSTPRIISGPLRNAAGWSPLLAGYGHARSKAFSQKSVANVAQYAALSLGLPKTRSVKTRRLSSLIFSLLDWDMDHIFDHLAFY